MSTSASIALTERERAELSAALAAAGLDISAETTWDSLDVACVLAVLEHSLGIVLDPAAAHPRLLRSAPALQQCIAAHGIRRDPAVRLRLDLTSHDDKTSETQRRQVEYRLSLAHPGTRAAVARRGPLTVLATADTTADLPVSASVLAALGIGATTSGEAAALSALPSTDVLRGGLAGQVIDTIESRVRHFVHNNAGQQWMPANSVITVSDLRQLGYYDAHPEQVFHLGTDAALLPAACLGAFAMLPSEPSLVSFLATVFRREPHYDAASGRLPSFACRELLWHTDSADELAMIDAIRTLLASLADELDLDWYWSAASDPFFLSAGDSASKLELRVKSAAGDIAIASVNMHGRHFTDRGHGRHGWHTGCTGLGLERWALVATSRS